MSHWVYQMTLRDEWEFDGVDETSLDQTIDGRPRNLLVHFGRQWLRIRVPRTNDGVLVAEKCDLKATGPAKIDMDKSSQMYGFR